MPTLDTHKQSVRVEVARERLRRLAGWIGELADDGGRGVDSVYVFDTDVIVMYGLPQSCAQYCALLRDERTSKTEQRHKSVGKQSPFAEAEVLLADLLGSFLVWERLAPALNSPAHVNELADVCSAIFYEAIAEREGAIQKIRECIDAIADSGEEGVLEERITRILNALKEVAPRMLEAIRLNAAFQNERIYSVEGFRLEARGGAGQAAYLPAAIDPQTGDLLEDIHTLSRQLEKVLVSRAKASEFAPRKIHADALALAHLCWMNQQLEGVGSPVRVRFVTGAPQLHRLCAPLASWEGHVSAEVLGLFERLQPELRALIRHPLAFVDESLGFSLGVWLNDRIPGDTLGEHDCHAILESTAEELVDLLRTALARKVVSPERHWLADVLQGRRLNQDWDILLKERIDALLPQFLAGLAVLQLGNYKGGEVSRNLPPLILTPFKVCEQFCECLYARHTMKSSEGLGPKERLAEVIANDASLYTPLIAIAMWCAAERDWLRARVMASAAVEVADRLRSAEQGGGGKAQESHPEVLGEEALYLKAMAIRLTAGLGHRKSDALSDIEDALKSLDGARERYREGGEVAGNGAMRRFDSEEISIRLTRHLFARLGKRAEVSRDEEQRLFDWAWERLEEHRDDEMGKARNRYLHEYVLQQLCVSMAQLVLIDRYGVSGDEVFLIVSSTWSETEQYRSKVAEVWQVFHDQCESLDHGAGSELVPVVSSFVGLVKIAFGLEFETSLPVARKNCLAEMVREFSGVRHRVAAIDSLRANFLSKITERKTRL